MPLRDHAFDDAESEPASRVALRFPPDEPVTDAERGREVLEGAPDEPSETDEAPAGADEAPTRPDIPAAVSFFGRVPTLVAARDELMRLPLDHRAGFLLSLIDGRSSVGAILDACAMPSDEALGILNALLAQHVVSLDA